jgi:Coenzyme F420 hydrogenase/dehydrogenase, beta subunit N-term
VRTREKIHAKVISVSVYHLSVAHNASEVTVSAHQSIEEHTCAEKRFYILLDNCHFEERACRLKPKPMVATCKEDILAARGVKPCISPNLNVLATVEALQACASLL